MQIFKLSTDTKPVFAKGQTRGLLELLNYLKYSNKEELFGLYCMKCFIWRQPNTASQHKDHYLNCKHNGVTMTAWDCFAVLGREWLAIIDGAMNDGNSCTVWATGKHEGFNL